MGRILDALERAREENTKRTEGSPVQPAPPPMPPGKPVADLPPLPPGENHRDMAEAVVGAHDNQSPIAEQVRQIRTNLETVLAEYRSRSIVITSPVTGDGKTLVAANLATVLADHPEQKILLVDADLRKPDQHHLYNVRQAPGLSEYLTGQCTQEEVVQQTSLPNLNVIAAGRPPDKPTVLLSSERMTNLLSEVQSTYQWIIFDTPPLLPVTDASVLARECVGLILVVRMGQTARTLIERSQDLLAEMRLPVLGCILNDFSSLSRSNNYYYKYYHKYGAKAGTRS